MTDFLSKLLSETLGLMGDFNIFRAHLIYRENTEQARPIIATFSEL